MLTCKLIVRWSVCFLVNFMVKCEIHAYSKTSWSSVKRMLTFKIHGEINFMVRCKSMLT